VKVWNAWREENPDLVPDLIRADLRGATLSGATLWKANFSGANLRNVDLSDADLSDADLSGADLSGATLSGADLRNADLFRATLRNADLRGANLFHAKLRNADLSGAHLRGADINSADLSGATLSGADLSHANLNNVNLVDADLRQARFIDTCLDDANLTGVKLWETQRGGWSIKRITCQWAFWDRNGNESTEYGDGDFERIFAEKSRIRLRYPGSLSLADLAMLPLIIKQLQAEHPSSILHIKSVEDEGSGANVIITVDDITGRNDDAFKKELVQLQTRLESILEERDYLRQRFAIMFSEITSTISDLPRLPTQEIHVHRPRELVTIEGYTMNGDTNINQGQTAIVGRDGHAHDMTFQQVWNQRSIDLPPLAEELKRLRAAMKEADGKDDQDEAIGAVAAAEKAAIKGDGPTTLQHLKTAGKWALGIAEKIGVTVATEAIKRAM